MTNPLPTGASWVSPYLVVTDVNKIVDFYNKAFTFQVKNVYPGEDGTSMHAELKYKDHLLMCGKENDSTYGKTMKSPLTSGVESPVSIYVYCENVDDFYKHAISQGAESLMAPEDMFWGDRMCRLRDPEHYIWAFATHIGGHHKG